MDRDPRPVNDAKLIGEFGTSPTGFARGSASIEDRLNATVSDADFLCSIVCRLKCIF